MFCELTPTRGAGEVWMGEETGVHVGEGDVHEERVVDVLVDESDGVLGEELGDAVVLERLRKQGGVVVEEASSG